MKKVKNFLYSGLAALTLFSSSCEKPEDEPIERTQPPKQEIPKEESPLYENAVNFDGSKLSETYNYGDDKIYFSAPLGDNYRTGSILGSAHTKETPFGMLVKLNSISSDRKSATVSPAALNEAIREGSLNYEEILSSENIDEELSKNLKSLEGVLINSSRKSTNDWGLDYNFDNTVIYDFDGDLNTTNDQTVLNGSLSLDIKPFLNADFKNGIKVYSGVESSGKAEIELTSDSEFSFSDEVEVWSKYFKPKSYLVAGFPVVLIPKLSVNVGAEGKVNSSLVTSVSDEFLAYAGIDFLGAGDWNFSKSFENKFNFNPPQLTANASAKAYAEIDFDLLVYGGPGLSAELENSLLLNADINSNPWYNLDWKLACNVGFDPGFLSATGIPEFNKEIFSITKNVAKSDGPFPGTGDGGERELDSLIIQPGPEGKDAWVRWRRISNRECDDMTEFHYGFGNDSILDVYLQYIEGTCGLSKSNALMEFSSNKFPQDIEIVSAKLDLYGHTSSNYVNRLPQLKFNLITQPWEENFVSYENKPETISSISHSFPNESGSRWNSVDVTDMIKYWNMGNQNYGFEISTEGNYSGGQFYSGDHPETDKRPKLTIYYHNKD